MSSTRLFRRNAETSTRDARAPQNFRRAGRPRPLQPVILLFALIAVPAAALVQIVIDEFYLQPRKPDYIALDREAAAIVEGER